MHDRNTRLSPTATTGSQIEEEHIVKPPLQDGASDAAAEVAEATDQFMSAGSYIEAAAQGERVAREQEARAGQGEVSAEERRSISRSVFRLAWPAIAENALQTLLGIVDTAVVARLGTDALSGVGASQQLIWV